MLLATYNFMNKNPGFKKNFGKDVEFKGYKLKGWASPEQLRWYNRVAGNVKNGIIIEVGVYGGQSLLGIVDTCTKNNNKLYGIDPWENICKSNGVELNGDNLHLLRSELKDRRENLEYIIKELNLNKTVKLIHGFSPHESNRFDNKSVDIVFIDGEHSYDAVTNDLKGWLPKIKKGGIISGDDFVWEAVKAAIVDFSKKNGLKVKNGKDINADERTWQINV